MHFEWISDITDINLSINACSVQRGGRALQDWLSLISIQCLLGCDWCIVLCCLDVMRERGKVRKLTSPSQNQVLNPIKVIKSKMGKIQIWIEWYHSIRTCSYVNIISTYKETFLLAYDYFKSLLIWGIHFLFAQCPYTQLFKNTSRIIDDMVMGHLPWTIPH